MPNPNANKPVTLTQAQLTFALSASKSDLENRIAETESELAVLKLIQSNRKFPGGAPKKISATKASSEGSPAVAASKEVIDLNDPQIQAEIASGLRGPNGKKRRADFGKPKGPRKPKGSKKVQATEVGERTTGGEPAGNVAEALTQEAPVVGMVTQAPQAQDEANVADDNVISTAENPVVDDFGYMVPVGMTRAQRRVQQNQQAQAANQG